MGIVLPCGILRSGMGRPSAIPSGLVIDTGLGLRSLNLLSVPFPVAASSCASASASASDSARASPTKRSKACKRKQKIKFVKSICSIKNGVKLTIQRLDFSLKWAIWVAQAENFLNFACAAKQKINRQISKVVNTKY